MTARTGGIRCPFAWGGDDGSARQCIERDHCGCDITARLLDLAEKADACMAVLGAYGTISARDDRVVALMDALHEVDPK